MNELLTPNLLINQKDWKMSKFKRRPDDYLQFSELRPVAQEIVLHEIHGGDLSSYDRIGIAKLVEQRLEAKGFTPRWSCCLYTAKIAQAIYISE